MTGLLSVPKHPSDYRAIRARLRNPPNAVVDRGINLGRDMSPPPPKKLLPSPDLPPLDSPPRRPGRLFIPSHETEIWRAVRNGICSGPPPPFLVAALYELQFSNDDRWVTIKDIQRAVAQEFDISCAGFFSIRRTKSIVLPRQVAMYLAKELTSLSLPRIGQRFGGRDHTTVLHAWRKIAALRACDPALDARIKKIIAALKGEV